MTLHPEGHVDGKGMVIGAEELELGGFRVVEAAKGGKLRVCDGWHDAVDAARLAIHREWGHWEALFRCR